MPTIVSIIGYVLLGCILFSFMHLMNTISDYFYVKKNIEKYESEHINELNTPQLSSFQKIESTNNLLNMINVLIVLEVNKMIETCRSINVKYELITIDKDITMISTHIFNGLSKDIFNNSDILLEDEFIMSYILDNTTLRLIDAARTYNSTFLN